MAGSDKPPAIRIAPSDWPELRQAVQRGGARPSDDSGRAEALIWTGGEPEKLLAELHDGIRWVQLPSAGVERWIDSGVVDAARTWTSAAGLYAAQVAEHAVALLLACVHRLPEHSRATSWGQLEYRPLSECTVCVLGAGGIGTAAARLLAPLVGEVLLVSRSRKAVPGFGHTLAFAEFGERWDRCDHLLLALPATPATKQLVDRDVLQALPRHAVVVNVGRGSAVDTDALVEAVQSEQIAGAGLDVTDPEPLPSDHPLWQQPRIVVSSHSANPSEALRGAFEAGVEENVRRFVAGDVLNGVISLDRGY